ncbi:hypothetical protein FHL15_011113 [Xylaria flabelliformis]|uniref:Uncharacterized protein n=1 Tax=Xylaria flabelliformis TaxID=2512241 RepID=A0A553HJ94_9PEZI|nr:hypothetical protein FHL15_011113 [Xylaria flabelliformis]
MRCEYHAIDASFGWVPTPHQKIHDHLIDLSVSEHQLSDYADAIDLVLSLAVPMDAALGPVGGGHSLHPIFENESLGENKSPREYQSVQELTEHINELAQPWISSDYRLADFSQVRMCYVMSNLNNGNAVFSEGEVYLIDHLNAGILPLSFMTYVSHCHRTVSEYLRGRLKLPLDNLHISSCTKGAFWLRDGDEEEMNGSQG